MKYNLNACARILYMRVMSALFSSKQCTVILTSCPSVGTKRAPASPRVFKDGWESTRVSVIQFGSEPSLLCLLSTDCFISHCCLSLWGTALCYYLQLLFQKKESVMVTEHQRDNFFSSPQLICIFLNGIEIKFKLIQADDLYPTMPFFFCVWIQCRFN